MKTRSSMFWFELIRSYKKSKERHPQAIFPRAARPRRLRRRAGSGPALDGIPLGSPAIDAALKRRISHRVAPSTTLPVNCPVPPASAEFEKPHIANRQKSTEKIRPTSWRVFMGIRLPMAAWMSELRSGAGMGVSKIGLVCWLGEWPAENKRASALVLGTLLVKEMDCDE